MNRPTGWTLSIALSLAGLAIPAARAQDAPPAPGEEGVLSLSLAEAVAMALAASPRLGELRALEEASGAALQLARAERKPLVELAAGYSRLSSVPEFGIPQPDGSTDVIFPDVRDSFASRLEASLPVYAGGALAGAEEAAGWDLEAAARDVESARADLVLETTVAYWAAVTTREAEGVLREAIASFEAHLADARNRERFGMAARSDVLAVQVERDRAELERLRAENARRTAEADLVRLLGLPAEEMVAPREALEPAPPDARGLESLLEDALARRPERASLEARIAAAESRVAAAAAPQRPRVSLAAGFDYANPNRRIVPVELDWEESWDLSVNVSMSL
jgi:outer membrane protein TolC